MMDDDENPRPGTLRPRVKRQNRPGSVRQPENRQIHGQNRQIPHRRDGSQASSRDQQNRSNNPSSSRRGPQDRYRLMGFVILEKIAKSNTKDTLIKLSEHKEGFMNMLNSPIRSPDIYFLIFEVLSKVSQSPFEELKSKLVLDVCNSEFISNLRNYLIDLPYADNKLQNKLYWENQNVFWKNFIIFCGDIVAISPATAVRRCRALIDNISITCLESLNRNNGLELSEEETFKMNEIRTKLASYAEGIKQKSESQANQMNDADLKPPENFRELSLLPTREDLLNSQPFLRPNIINGGYSDVEHYLDVQFRLLREDCFGPLRVGISQYVGDPNKRKYDNVRVYQNVKFAGPYVSNFKVGSLIQIDLENNKYLKKINWAYSKRLLFGSLLLFTKDNFNSIIVATILDRNNTLLATGKLAVAIIEGGSEYKILAENTYTMIESEVYFEPYYHVLKALKTVSTENLAMHKYIVYINQGSSIPAYLTDDKVFVINNSKESKNEDELEPESNEDAILSIIRKSQTLETPEIKFNVLIPNSWPTKEELNFNKSQYEAFQLALTHEFAVIQGPPGTGKTYIGLHIAKTLLQNITSKNSCLMLVICYTNHALDQFLEGIAKVTSQIVRIGSQSRNEAIDKFNLTNLRKEHKFHTSKVGNFFTETKSKLKESIGKLQDSLLMIDILNDGVINYNAFDEDIPQLKNLCNYYKKYPSIKDPLKHWLFENQEQYRGDFNRCLTKYSELNIDQEDNELNKMRTDSNIMLEDKEKKTQMENYKKQNAAFLLIDAQLQMKILVKEYMKHLGQDFKGKMQLEYSIENLNCMINLFNEMAKYRSREVYFNISDATDFSRFSTQTRWCLYFMWIKNKIIEVKMNIQRLQATVSYSETIYEETRMMMDMELLQNKKTKVLGLTTSGAARMRRLVQAISPKIVIVEEAAEVLEQHIITSLTKDCEHLILIGDHQQLRPSASYIKLAKHYNIDISLFERMITNGVHSRRLRVQHRMRPEIAALISPHIYPDLENHPSVEHFVNVRGLEKSVFFFSHEYPEEVNIGDGVSRANHKEADITLALANYIMQQGIYTSEDVTILTAYSGQMFYMRKERPKYALLREVKITVVDNYQGEESKIILLSLVRNNEENNIGFLGTENRICVALSRAKQGFYLFGNINMLKAKSELWRKIAGTLESNHSLGTTLKLKCQVHPDQITSVETVDDFNKVPEGGCSRKCDYQYNCGHICPLYCHGNDRQHNKIQCMMQCERILCDLGHVCPLKCFEKCGQCEVYVKKNLPCGHEMNVFCHREPDDPNNKCNTTLEVTLPNCEHKAKKPCYVNINKVKCIEKCKQRLETCGHACERVCHVADPDHTKYLCEKECSKPKNGCKAELEGDFGKHQCKKQCYEKCDDCNVQVKKKRSTCKHVQKVACCVNVDDVPCKAKCARTMLCGHFCKKPCSEECGDCKIMVTKEIPDCKHKIKIQCMIKVERKHCQEKCERTLSCGHKCQQRCIDICDATQCKEPTAIGIPSPCGHEVNLPCNLYTSYAQGKMKPNELLKYCKSPCREDLACKHLCRGTCSQCHQGRLHMPCKQTCNQINICGHQCLEPCNQMCPPCSMVCEVRCAHSRCGRLCGQPCVPCKEACSRRCAHGACSRRCGEACSRAACSAACAARLACGHRCRGVCGEPCPDVCRHCRPEQFPTDFLGDEYGEDEKFILLQDCGHVMELENMDTLMKGDMENIKIRQCPFCRKPIINTNRYKDLVNNMFKNDINPIKERVYGKNLEINKKMKELESKTLVIYEKCLFDSNLRDMIIQFTRFIKAQKKVYLLLVEMFIIYFNIIEMITDCWLAYKKTKTSVLREEFEENIALILQVMKINPKSKVPLKISEQQQKDIANEIKRLNTIVQLVKVLEVATPSASLPKVKALIDAAKSSVLTVTVFEEDKALESLKNLQTTVNSTCTISKMEREMIVKAIGVKAGAWYKCPNGHLYCIGECGGANQISKCPECKEAIGGTSHRLLSNNSHASEMDGSRFAAFTNEANNMGNYRF